MDQHVGGPEAASRSRTRSRAARVIGSARRPAPAAPRRARRRGARPRACRRPSAGARSAAAFATPAACRACARPASRLRDRAREPVRRPPPTPASSVPGGWPSTQRHEIALARFGNALRRYRREDVTGACRESPAASGCRRRRARASRRSPSGCRGRCGSRPMDAQHAAPSVRCRHREDGVLAVLDRRDLRRRKVPRRERPTARRCEARDLLVLRELRERHVALRLPGRATASRSTSASAASSRASSVVAIRVVREEAHLPLEHRRREAREHRPHAAGVERAGELDAAAARRRSPGP